MYLQAEGEFRTRADQVGQFRVLNSQGERVPLSTLVSMEPASGPEFLLMTAFAFILGVVPLAVSSGAGAEARRLIGTAVIGGMLAASLIAIFLIPVSFYVVERLAGRHEPEPTLPTVAGPAPVAGARD